MPDCDQAGIAEQGKSPEGFVGLPSVPIPPAIHGRRATPSRRHPALHKHGHVKYLFLRSARSDQVLMTDPRPQRLFELSNRMVVGTGRLDGLRTFRKGPSGRNPVTGVFTRVLRGSAEECCSGPRMPLTPPAHRLDGRTARCSAGVSGIRGLLLSKMANRARRPAAVEVQQAWRPGREP